MEFIASTLSWNAVIVLVSAILAILYLLLLSDWKYRFHLVLILTLVVGGLFISDTLSVGNPTCPGCAASCRFILDSAGNECKIIKTEENFGVVIEYPDDCESVSYDCLCTSSNYQIGRCDSCKTYFDVKGGYDDCLARTEEAGDQTPEIVDAISKAEIAKDRALSQRATWEMIQREHCDANGGILYDYETSYCNGFQDVEEYKALPLTEGGELYEFPELDAVSACCTGTLLDVGISIGEAIRQNIIAGSVDDYSELLASRILDDRTIRTADNGISSVCFTSTYLCSNAFFDEDQLSTTIYCDQNDLYFCEFGCNMEGAGCSNEDVIIIKDGDQNAWLVIGLIVILILIFLMAMLIFRKNKRKWRR